MKMKITLSLIFLCIILCQNIEKEVLLINDLKKEKINKMNNTIENTPKRSPVKMNANLNVTGEMTAKEIIVDELIATGNVHIKGEAKANQITVDKVESGVIVVEKIVPPNGVLTIEGNVVMTNDLIGDKIAIKGGSYAMNGIKQWQLIKHDDFESKDSTEGWSDKRVNKCKKENNRHLGGHCNFSYNEVTKVFTGLPTHQKVRINALYHMLDKWNGEKGYMKINGKIFWSQQGFMKEKGVDLCGGNYNDPEMNIAIDVLIDHTDNDIIITFGSTLKGDPCEQSFGIDDVMIYTK